MASILKRYCLEAAEAPATEHLGTEPCSAKTRATTAKAKHVATKTLAQAMTHSAITKTLAFAKIAAKTLTLSAIPKTLAFATIDPETLT